MIMKDEIKEILDNIYKIIKFGYEPEIIKEFGYREFYKLNDYITNLQKENERLKETQYVWSYDLDMQLEDYKSRCEKAIEYINKYPCETWYYAKDRQLILRQDELLNILQGVDKDE